MIINPYAFGAGAPPTVYLDSLAVAPKAVLSLRKLISTATVAIRVRRSSDNTEQDIGFTGDALDTASLASFVGAGSGYITKWYDQTGNGFHAIQATTASQPRIVNAGVYDGKIVTDGSNDLLVISSLTMGTSYLGVYGKFAPTSVADKVMWELSANSSTSAGAAGLLNASGIGFLPRMTGNPTANQRSNSFSVTADVMAQHTLLFNRALSGTDEIKCWTGGSANTPTAQATNEMTSTFITSSFNIGARSGGAAAAAMSYETLAIYSADSSAIRSSIESAVA